jgi:hypothetical protein
MSWFLIRGHVHNDMFEERARVTNTMENNEKLVQGAVSNKVFIKQSSRSVNLM